MCEVIHFIRTIIVQPCLRELHLGIKTFDIDTVVGGRCYSCNKQMAILHLPEIRGFCGVPEWTSFADGPKLCSLQFKYRQAPHSHPLAFSRQVEGQQLQPWTNSVILSGCVTGTVGMFCWLLFVVLVLGWWCCDNISATTTCAHFILIIIILGFPHDS